MHWGNSLILGLQGFAGLTGVMRFFTFLGSEYCFLFLMPVLYWCLDVGVGARLAVVLIFSNGLNGLFKIAFHLSRPYWIDPRVQALSSEPTYGLPSGHAMNSTTTWGFLAAQVKKWWAWVGAGVLIVMVSFSRLYLGMHFPTDVLAGWILGVLLLWVFLAWERPVLVWLKRLTTWQQIGLAFVLSLAFLALYFFILSVIAPSPDPVVWEQNAAKATGAPFGVPAISPRNPEDGVTGAGMFMGLGLAFALALRRPTEFVVQAPLARRVLRFGVGMLGVLVFWLGLKLVSPSEPVVLAWTVRYIRYLLVVFWVLYLAPCVFVRLRL